MNIAVVGGGQRCLELIELIEKHSFHEISPRILAVADEDQQSPGLVRARQMGLFVSSDYNDLFDRDDINLIIELKDSMDIYNDILEKKGKAVRAISSTTARLFWEIGKISDLHQKTFSKLQKAEAMSDLIFNKLIHEEVLVIANDYRILDINDALLHKTGLNREDVIGKFCYEITHRRTIPCNGSDHPCPLVETLASGKPSQATHTHLDKDNRELYYSISCYPIFENDKVAGVVEISRDITRDINYQKTMMNQEKMISIGRLSAGVAHEINNPLTTILTTAMLIQEDLEMDDPLFGELEIISKETIRCREIVTSLLNFARQSTPEKKKSNINSIIEESILLMKKQAAFNDITITQSLEETIPLILVDKGQIQQAVINLLINAVEATAPGGEIKVSTRLITKPNILEIAIQDTGIGMDEKTTSRIFDPFFTNKDNGTGLGLAITHGIIQQHDGTIHVESKTGEGSTFFIRFPLKQEDDHV